MSAHGAEFQGLLSFHFFQGTSPTGRPKTPSGRWTNELLAKSIGVQTSTVNNWRNGYTFPTLDNFVSILKLLFGVGYIHSIPARNLIKSYNQESPYHLDVLEPLADVDEIAIQQLPAAFRFGVQNGKIDAISETYQTVDGPAAKDLYDELREKLQALMDRLRRSNIDPHARFSAEKLLRALGTVFEDVRPGVVLSRMRSMEAIRDAFSTEEGREGLFPNAIAMIDDVCLTGQDFLATYPIIRQIERQRLALGIEKTPDAINNIQIEIEAVQKAAAASEVVAAAAVSALGENDSDIKDANSAEQTAELIGDKLLIIRNFVSEAIRSVVQGATASAAGAWGVIKPDFHDGARAAARILPPLAVIALITSIAGPIAGLAGLLRGNIFTPIRSAVSRVQSADQKAHRTRKD